MLMAGMAPTFESSEGVIYLNRALKDWKKRTADVELWLDPPATHDFLGTNQRLTMYEQGHAGTGSAVNWRRMLKRVSKSMRLELVDASCANS